MEKIGIEHVGDEKRHGFPFNTFTLWFGANLTIADFALGSLFFGLPFSSIIIAIIVGNVLGRPAAGLERLDGPHLRISSDDDLQGGDGQDGERPVRGRQLDKHGGVVHGQHHPGRLRPPAGLRAALLPRRGGHGRRRRDARHLWARHHPHLREGHVGRPRGDVRGHDRPRLPQDGLELLRVPGLRLLQPLLLGTGRRRRLLLPHELVPLRKRLLALPSP